jgi:hypothetical protein
MVKLFDSSNEPDLDLDLDQIEDRQAAIKEVLSTTDKERLFSWKIALAMLIL